MPVLLHQGHAPLLGSQGTPNSCKGELRAPPQSFSICRTRLGPHVQRERRGHGTRGSAPQQKAPRGGTGVPTRGARGGSQGAGVGQGIPGGPWRPTQKPERRCWQGHKGVKKCPAGTGLGRSPSICPQPCSSAPAWGTPRNQNLAAGSQQPPGASWDAYLKAPPSKRLLPLQRGGGRGGSLAETVVGTTVRQGLGVAEGGCSKRGRWEALLAPRGEGLPATGAGGHHTPNTRRCWPC